jgi:hypothetical protein
MIIVLVKNMVCHRCVVSVEDILNKADVPFNKVIFSEIHLTNEISREQKDVVLDTRYTYGLSNISNGQEMFNRYLNISLHFSKPWKTNPLGRN